MIWSIRRPILPALEGYDSQELSYFKDALQEGEDHFLLIAENAPTMLWMGNEHGKCVYLNAALRKFWGVRAENIPSFDWSNTLHPDDQEKLYEPYGRAMVERAPFVVEARFRRYDGEIRLLRTEARPRFSPSGQFAGMIGVNVDVTDSREAELVLREETSALEVLNRIGAAVAAELDIERLVQLVTDAGVQLTSAQFGAFFYNVISDAGEAYTLYTLSGVPRKAFANFPQPRATRVFAPTFKGEGVVRSGDITKDPRYGHNSPHFGMPKGHLPVRSYLAIPVQSRSEVLGGLFFGHPDPDVFTERSERLGVGLAAQAAIAIDNARLFHAAQREINQRRRAEEALQELNATLEQQILERTKQLRAQEEALRHVQKMEAVGQLTGGVAHDFNNLLQVIMGNLEILQRSLPADAARLSRTADNAMSGARRAAALTQRLLAFSRRQPLDPKPIEVNDLVTGMIELIQRSIGTTILVETVLAPSLLQIEADPSEFENALLNLALNARDAMPQGGTLIIETAYVHIDQAYANEHGGIAAGRYVVLCVSDTGHGMDKATIDRAFEPFFTTKEPGKGTGLGLSQVYGFAKQSRGHIKLYSQPDRGAAVKLYLPCLDREEAVSVAETGAIETARGETILVVEGDDCVRAHSMDMLQELGCSVMEAHDGQSALELLGREAKINLLVTDAALSGSMTGAQLSAQARLLRPDLKVLFTKDCPRDADAFGDDLDLCALLLTKPLIYAELAAKLRAMLGSNALETADGETVLTNLSQSSP